MTTRKTKNCTCVVKDRNGKIVGYLTAKDEERGEDIRLATQGYIIEAL